MAWGLMSQYNVKTCTEVYIIMGIKECIHCLLVAAKIFMLYVCVFAVLYCVYKP